MRKISIEHQGGQWEPRYVVMANDEPVAINQLTEGELSLALRLALEECENLFKSERDAAWGENL